MDLLPLSWVATALVLAFVILLIIDHKQTPRNIVDGVETNRFILALYTRYGWRGVDGYFIAWILASLAFAAIALRFDAAGAAIVVGVFACGLELSVVRENYKRQKRQ